MIARISTLYLLPGTLDELTRTIQDSLAPEIAKGQGFGGLMVLHELQMGQVLVLELWETEADLVASYSSSGASLPALTSSLRAELSMHSVYEISVHVEVTEQGAAHVRGI